MVTEVGGECSTQELAVVSERSQGELSEQPAPGGTSTGKRGQQHTTGFRNQTRVIIRVRPPASSEGNHTTCDDHVGGSLEVAQPEATLYKFGIVLGTKCSQHEVYLSCGVPMIEAALKGRHSLLFAYGQSGAGKTFSMYGAEGGKNPSKLDGAVPATVAELFRRTTVIEKESVGTTKFSLGATLVEIQKNLIFDLLAEPDKYGNQPLIRAAGTNLIGHKVERIFSSRSLTHIIERGMASRTTLPNVMHANSSRSHCLLMLTLEKKRYKPDASKAERDAGLDLLESTTSKFYMVDLAGSEAFDYDAEKGAGMGINAGLLALGRVIMAMSERSPHIPYRDNIITQLLIGALDSDAPCLTQMLCCLSPNPKHASDTKCSLTYAQMCAKLEADNDPVEDAEAPAEPSENATTEHAAIASASPMANDEYDEDDELNRRAELIEVKNGTIFCRSGGDPTNPLCLYVHDSGSGVSSKHFNELMTQVSYAVRANFQLVREAEQQKVMAQATTKKRRGNSSEETSTVVKEKQESKDRASGKGGQQASFEAAGFEQGQDAVQFDDRFTALRGSLSRALLGRQTELMSTVCSLCASAVLEPSRLSNCRHVLCGLCVERTIMYHRECPVCFTECGPPEHDKALDLVMRLRMDSLKQTPIPTVVWRARLDEQVEERRKTLRLVLDFGTILAGPGKRTSVTCFVGIRKDGDGSLIRRGDLCQQQLDAETPESIISKVVFDRNPGSKDEKAEELFMTAITSPVKSTPSLAGYATSFSMSRGSYVHITVHWSAQIGVAPLEIRHQIGRVPSGRWQRTLVVQLAPELPVLREGSIATPVRYQERRGKEVSGWIYYHDALQCKAVGSNARVAMGPANCNSLKSLGEFTLNDKHFKEMCQALSSPVSEEAAKNCLGSIGQANFCLCLAASKGLEMAQATSLIEQASSAEARSPSPAAAQDSPQATPSEGTSDDRTTLSSAVSAMQVSPEVGSESTADSSSGSTQTQQSPDSSSSRPSSPPCRPSPRQLPSPSALPPPGQLGMPHSASPPTQAKLRAGSMSARRNSKEAMAGKPPRGTQAKKAKQSPTGNASAKAFKASTLSTADLKETGSLLLRSACYSGDAGLGGVYSQMLALISPDAPPKARKIFLRELNIEEIEVKVEHPNDLFHVAIDLPGHGYTRANVQAKRRPGDTIITPELLADTIKSLGKTYAFMIVSFGAAAAEAVVKALVEKPNLTSFLCMYEPKIKEPHCLYSIFQPTLVAFTPSSGAHATEIERAKANMVEPLMHKKVSHLRCNPKKQGDFDKALAEQILALFVDRNWRGHLEGTGHSKLDPLLTRLAGGMCMFRGDREYREAKLDMSSAPAAAPAAAPSS